MIGENELFNLAESNFKRYAEKINADLIICRKPKISENFQHLKSKAIIPCLEKFQIKEFLDNYNRVLYLDADIIITPNAKDIFSSHSDPNYLYLCDEGPYTNRKQSIQEIQNLLGEVTWPKKWFKYIYYNAGVMLFSKKQQYLFDYIDFDIFSKLINVELFEQTYINYLLFKHNIPVKNLSTSFNRLDTMSIGALRFRQNFIHYAGAGYSKNHNREEQYKKDFKKLYSTI